MYSVGFLLCVNDAVSFSKLLAINAQSAVELILLLSEESASARNDWTESPSFLAYLAAVRRRNVSNFTKHHYGRSCKKNMWHLAGEVLTSVVRHILLERRTFVDLICTRQTEKDNCYRLDYFNTCNTYYTRAWGIIPNTGCIWGLIKKSENSEKRMLVPYSRFNQSPMILPCALFYSIVLMI